MSLLEGYDETFVSAVPGYLRCIVCRLVLRKPVQIMRCGHRFCQPCFSRIKKHCDTYDSQLLCPLDRVPIDLCKVFEDTGIDRVVADLLVRCGTNGCRWVGAVRNLTTHREECRYQHHPPSSDDEDDDDDNEVEDNNISGGVAPDNKEDMTLVKELNQRMAMWENCLLEKEKDIALLKKNFDEMKTLFCGKMNEVESLKKENRYILAELERVKEKQEEFMYNNERLENIESRIESYGDDSRLMSAESRLAINLVIESNKDNDDDDDVSTIPDSEYNDLPPSYENHRPVGVNVSSNASSCENVGRSTDQGGRIENRLFYIPNEQHRRRSSGQSQESDQLNRLNKLYSAHSVNESELRDRRMVGGYDRLNISSTSNNTENSVLNDSLRKIIDLKDHITNIENILFCETPNGKSSKEITFRWIVQNYSDHQTKGEPVYSPIFFTEIKGYCFRLKVGWTGDEKEHLAVGLHLCRGRFSERELEPFDLQYSIEMSDRDGNIFAEKIPLCDVEEYRIESFSISPGQNCAQRACGNAKFLSRPKLDEFVVNDMLFLKCRVILQNKVSPLKRPARLFKNRYF